MISKNDIIEISEKDIFEQLQYSAGSLLFLNRFTLREVYEMLERVGLTKRAKRVGFNELKFELEAPDVSTQRILIFNKEKNPDNLLVDMMIKIEKLVPKGELKKFFGKDVLNFIFLEWLTLQNPYVSFTKERPRLPGQKHPGLHIKKELIILFRYLARVLQLDGYVARPQFFHNAMMYMDFFKFLEPEKEGEFKAIYDKFINELGFAKLSWAVYEECLRYGFLRRHYIWKCGFQIFPLKKRIMEYFDSKEYKKKFEESYKKWFSSIKINEKCLKKISLD